MTVALYATIWIALLLLVAAEVGKSRLAGPDGAASWARVAWTVGGLLLVVHVLIALHVRYGWHHEAAVAATARQAAEVYGFEWRGSIYVSYLFTILWLLEAVRWPRHRPDRSRTTWALRVFFLVVIANGAIVFATPAGRILGTLVVATLLWAWAPGMRGVELKNRKLKIETLDS
jgi:hypothetical protein